MEDDSLLSAPILAPPSGCGINFDVCLYKFGSKIDFEKHKRQVYLCEVRLQEFETQKASLFCVKCQM